LFFFFSSRRRHTRCYRDWSSDVCSSDLRKTLSARRGSGRPSGLPPRTWAVDGRTVLLLLLYAVGFLLAESVTWRLAFALSPKVRSEERRVGKECRMRRWRSNKNKRRSGD